MDVFSPLLMLFSFVEGEDLICLVAALYYVPGGWVAESQGVHDGHLFVLQIHTSSFVVGQQGEMVYHFSQCSAV
jgi:hypothetical protein